jgi:hypothetical protein
MFPLILSKRKRYDGRKKQCDNRRSQTANKGHFTHRILTRSSNCLVSIMVSQARNHRIDHRANYSTAFKNSKLPSVRHPLLYAPLTVLTWFTQPTEQAMRHCLEHCLELQSPLISPQGSLSRWKDSSVRSAQCYRCRQENALGQERG